MYDYDDVAEVRRSAPDELFLLTIEVRPEPGSNGFGKFGGAFINCWVNADTLRVAERRVVSLIREGGWYPYRFESWELVTQATYDGRESGDDEPDFRRIVTQAFIDGEVSVIHTWPFDAADGANDD